MKHILFVFPLIRDIPTGGLKVIYDYANRLIIDDYDVTIAYVAYFKYTDKTFFRKLKSVTKFIFAKCVLSRSGYTWYRKNSKIKEIYIWEISQKSIPFADCYIATAVCTAPYVDDLPINNKKKYYFIQGYETFLISDSAFVKGTYRLPLKKIVISNWLAKMVAQEGCESLVIPNGFDSSLYKLTIPIEQKDKYLVSMLYHINPVKDVDVGIRAVALAKKVIPQLRLVMFGAYPKPNDLPEWVSFFENPTLEEHLWINNQAAIYVGCSRMEGWGLTVGEAMMCGQAVACTDNEGYLEMACNGKNALVTPIMDAEALSKSIITLVNNDELRYAIAKQAYKSIKNFDFEKSYIRFRDFITD